MKKAGGFIKRQILFLVAFLFIFTLSLFGRNNVYSADYNYQADPEIAWTYHENPTEDYDWPLLTTTYNNSIYLVAFSYPGGETKWNIVKISESTGIKDSSFGVDGIIQLDPLSTVDPKGIIVNEAGIFILTEEDTLSTVEWSVYGINANETEANLIYTHQQEIQAGDWADSYPVKFFDRGDSLVIFGFDTYTDTDPVMISTMKWITARISYTGSEVYYNSEEKSNQHDYLRDVSEDEGYYYLLGENGVGQYWYIQKLNKSNFSNVWQVDYDTTDFGFSPFRISLNDTDIFFVDMAGGNQTGKLDKDTGTAGWNGETVSATGEGLVSFGGLSVDNEGVYLFQSISQEGCSEDTCYGYLVERWDAVSMVKTNTIEYYYQVDGEMGDLWADGGRSFEGGFYVWGERKILPGPYRDEEFDYEWFINKYTFSELIEESQPPTFENLYDQAKNITFDEGEEVFGSPFEVRVHPTDTSGIKDVKFYIDGELRETDTTRDVNNEYSFNWEQELNESRVTVTACDLFNNCASLVRNVLYNPSDVISETINELPKDNTAIGLSYPYLMVAHNTDPRLTLVNLESNTSALINTVGNVSSYTPAIDGDYVVWPDKTVVGDYYRTKISLYQISTGITTTIRSGSDGVTDVAISGNDIVWQEGYMGEYRISIYNIITGQTVMLPVYDEEFGYYEIDISDGLVAYSNIISLDGGDSYRNQIFTYNISTGVTNRLTGTAELSQDNYTPVTDGKYVAYQCSRDTDIPYELCYFDLYTNEETILHNSDIAGAYPPGISDSYIYMRTSDGTERQLRVYDIISGTWSVIPGDQGNIQQLVDGNKVFSTVLNVELSLDEPTITEVYTRDLINPIFINFEGSADRINIVQNQVITANPYQIKVKPVDNSAAGAMGLGLGKVAAFPGGIDRVEFRVDGVLIGTDYWPDGDGLYDCNWDTSRYQSDISIVAFDINGNESLPILVSTTVNLPGDEDVPDDEVVVPPPVAGGTDEDPGDLPGDIVNAPADDQPKGEQDVSDNTDSQNNQPVPSEAKAENVSEKGFFEGLLSALMGFISEVPPVVAFVFPYLLFLLLAIASYLAYYQAKSELASIKKLTTIAEAEKILYEEKANFLMLSSHYLRTPMTLIKGGFELMESDKSIKANALERVKKIILDLGGKIETILNNIENSSYLAAIKEPQKEGSLVKRYGSLYIVLPILFIATIVIVANVLFVNVKKIDPNIINFLTQLVLFVVVSELFAVSLRKMLNAKKETIKYKVMIKHQRDIDQARSNFMQEVSKQLDNDLGSLRSFSDKATSKDAAGLKEGEIRLELIMDKINLLSEIRTTGLHGFSDRVGLPNLISEIARSYSDKLKEKNIKVENKISIKEVVTDKQKLQYVLISVFDNAVKFSKENGKISIRTSKAKNAVKVEIKDTGIGIPDKEMVHLFKPFSRAGSALDFDFEGLGLGLYLSKIIANYLGGDVELISSQKSGTTVTIWFRSW
jgi:signal transduction histidine kinase